MTFVIVVRRFLRIPQPLTPALSSTSISTHYSFQPPAPAPRYYRQPLLLTHCICKSLSSTPRRAMSWTSSVEKSGEYKRKDSAFREWTKADGSSEFKPEKDRYHLYVSLACPWACRVLVVRRLKGLEDYLPFTVVDWMLDKSTGWNFIDGSKHPNKPHCEIDPVNEFTLVKQIYQQTKSDYNGNITVPVLYDKKLKKIVNNESADLIQMLNSEWNDLIKDEQKKALDLYPEKLRKEIDEVNDITYNNINNGVYRCGFANSQEAYEKAFNDLFTALDKVEAILGKHRYLVGNQLTLADVRLFTTLIRFDAVYNVHFKCNGHRIIDYPNLHGYMVDLYNNEPAFAADVDFVHIKHHYYASHKHINPYGIVPVGPLDLEEKLDKKYAESRKKFQQNGH